MYSKQPENQKVGEWIQVSCRQKTSYVIQFYFQVIVSDHYHCFQLVKTPPTFSSFSIKDMEVSHLGAAPPKLPLLSTMSKIQLEQSGLVIKSHRWDKSRTMINLKQLLLECGMF